MSKINNIDLEQTFVNPDEVRGWGVRNLYLNRGKFAKHKNKRYAQALVAFCFAYAGFVLYGDLMEKRGFWRGVDTIIDEKWDEGYIDDAKAEGYDMLWEQQD